jgi:hypothetical protein
MLGVSLRVNLYITQEDQVFIDDVVVIDLTWKWWLQVSLVDQQV